MTHPLASFPRDHHRGGQGVCSVCSAHVPTLAVAIDRAKRNRSAVLIEATSNQVDQFGGYTGMTPAGFRDRVESLARERGLPGDALILGGDHLGPNPWRGEPAAAAMDKARELVRQYAAAGFGKIHLDCSMALGGDAGAAPAPETAAERAAALSAVAETAAVRAGREAPVYVIGTEVPIPGGATHDLDAGPRPTSAADAEATLEIHRRAFAKAGLDAAWSRVIGLVVQPGVEFGNYTVADYDRNKAAELSAFMAGRGDLVFEAHSTDYQTPRALAEMVEDHYAIVKVGPWLTFAYREALFALDAIAGELASPVGLRETLEAVMTEKPDYWRGHYHGDETALKLARAFSFSDRIRYYWPEPRVQAATDRLMNCPALTAIPLSLLEQYLPGQCRAVREGELARLPRALAEYAIGTVLETLARATARP